MREVLEKLFKEQDLLFLGSVDPNVDSDHSNYSQWLSENRHASMEYLKKNSQVRKDANLILPNTKSVLTFALPYYLEDKETEFKYALYSQFQDYHSILKKRGEQIVEKLKGNFVGDYKVVVDSAPVLERALAAKSKEGFIGKNTCYIHPKFGSFLLLGEIFTTVEFAVDQNAKTESCETCTLCQVACPTGALDEDYKIDSRKCIAYWTIENRGTIPFEYWPFLKEYVFGCDICQKVCPYNSDAPNTLPKSIKPREYPGLYEVATMNQAQYEKYFGGTPVTRAKKEGLQRNALIAMAVGRHEKLNSALECINSESHTTLQATKTMVLEYKSSY